MTDLNETIDSAELGENHIERQVASKGARFGNAIVDGLTSGLLAGALSNYIVMGEFSIIVEPHGDELNATLIQYLIITAYYIIMEASLGKTLGKYVTGTRVVNHQGDNASIGQIIGRSFARLIPFDAFSFLGEKGIGWHDSLPKTYVIKEQ